MDKIKQTVTINGRVFDVRTGRPIVPGTRKTNPSQAHHHKKQTRVINDFGPKRVVATPPKAKVVTTPKTVAKPQAHKNRTAAPHRTQKLQKSTTLRRDLLAKPAQVAKTNTPRRRRHVAQSALVSRFANNTPASHESKLAKQTSEDKELLAQQTVLHRAHQEHVKHQAIAAQPVHPKEVKEQLLSNQLNKATEVNDSYTKTPW